AVGFREQHLAEPLRVDRVAEQMPLRIVAAVLAQELELLLGFDAFRDDLELEAMRHLDDRIDDCRVIAIDRDVADERAIDLQRADRKLLQRRKRRVPRAEVVDREVQTHAVQRVENPDRSLGIFHQRRFRDLELEERRRYAMAAERLAYL